MTQPDTFKIPYQLIADPNGFEVSPSDLSQVHFETLPTIEIHPTHTIYDLYNELIQTLEDSHRFITIQFPCIVPEPSANGELEEDNQNPSHSERPPEWKDLVGYSGYRYDPSMTIEELQSCWPREEDDSLQPMQVVAIPKGRVENLPHIADETEEQLKERVHLMDSMYDLFYANQENRVIWMPTVDSKFKKRSKVWIRSCWEEFQLGIIANFLRSRSQTPFTQTDLKTFRQRHRTDTFTQPSTDDTELWKTIQETPEWINMNIAHASPFRQLTKSRLLRSANCCKAFYVSGQPGTGKSLMLLYLVHCLMKKIYKVAILYILPNMPVITILVDHSNLYNPIRIRSHASSLGETWYTNGFPVIRIVDSVEPFANNAMRGVFTVYAASPTKYKIQVKMSDHETPDWRGEYPFWTAEEFYTMMRCLKMTGREHWIRRVRAKHIVKLHPLVITLLGAHGCLEDGSVEAAGELAPPAPDPIPAISNGLHPTVEDRLLSMSSLNRQRPSNSTLELLQFTAMNGSARMRNHIPSLSDVALDLNAHLPNDDLSVYLNVIEVFGLSPRALSADMDNTFERMSEVFGWEGIALTGPEASVVLSSLTASHFGSRPVSEFASRFLGAMSTITAEGFLKKIGNRTIPEVLRYLDLEHKVNEELLRSHSRFTLYSITPHLFPTSYCTFPAIDRCAMTSAELITTQRFSSNVLYYESLFDSETNKDQKSWTGIHSFIYFHDKDSIKLFTFHTAVNSQSEDVNYRLIEKVKNVLEDQHANSVRGKGKKEGMRKEKVEVFFVLIAKPEAVKGYLDRNTVFRVPAKHARGSATKKPVQASTPMPPAEASIPMPSTEGSTRNKPKSPAYLSYNIGVVSVSDLLFNEFSGLEGPVTKRPKIDCPWNTDDDDFRKCFVMKEQPADPRHPQGISIQPVLRPETTPEPRRVLMVDQHHQQRMTIQPRVEGTKAFPIDVESDDLNDLEEEAAGEDILPPRQVSKRKGSK